MIAVPTVATGPLSGRSAGNEAIGRSHTEPLSQRNHGRFARRLSCLAGRVVGPDCRHREQQLMGKPVGPPFGVPPIDSKLTSPMGEVTNFMRES